MSRERHARLVKNALKKLEDKSPHSSPNELRIIVALERAVARLECHPKLTDYLVFKGGFVLLKMANTIRFTRDVDALAIGVSRTSIVKMVQHALQLDLHDGFWFGDVQVDDLKDQGPYGGHRFNSAFQIGDPPKEETKIKKLSRLHIDIGFGDALTKQPPKSSMTSIIPENNPVSWSVYPMEYIFAEKLEALCSRGSVSSRAKDIFDMQLIFPKCEIGLLRNAITKTFEGRKTPIPESFQETTMDFDLKNLREAWNAVDLANESMTFTEAWKVFVSYLGAIDDR